jgi:hypothetical protein
MADTPEGLEGINITPEASELIVHDIAADSFKAIRRVAYVGIALIVIIVLVGIILLLHGQSVNHTSSQSALTSISTTLSGDKQAILNSCKAAAGK